MSRLIEFRHVSELPRHLTVRVGDVLLFGATGGHVRSGGDAVEKLGPFVPGVPGSDGGIISPMGAPNALLILARRPGRATVEVIFGDPWRAPEAVKLELTVES